MAIDDESIESWYEQIEAGEEAAVIDATSAILANGFDYDAAMVRAAAMASLGFDEDAMSEVETIVERAPGDIAALELAADIQYALCRFDDCERSSQEVLRQDPRAATATYWLGLIAERRGDLAEADRLLGEAHRLSPAEVPAPVTLSDENFAQVIQHAIEELPDAFQEAIKTVAIIEDSVPADELLDELGDLADPHILGLYVGTPISETSVQDPPELPPRIHLFRRNIQRAGATVVEISEEVAVTLYHEIGHHLGYDEGDLADLGLE